MEGFAQLQPMARSAFASFTSSPRAACSGAHNARQLWKLPGRRYVSIDHERALEECGLVDAQGLAFTPTKVDTLPVGWSCEPFGHLYRIVASDLGSWLAAPPSEATIEDGRRALEPLLLETFGDGGIPEFMRRRY
jgi:hypothetical protein